MLIRIGKFDITECWDGVFYKKLSRYPGITTWEIQTMLDFSDIMVLFSFQRRFYEWGRTLKQHISTAGFVGCVPTDAPTSEKSG